MYNPPCKKPFDPEEITQTCWICKGRFTGSGRIISSVYGGSEIGFKLCIECLNNFNEDLLAIVLFRHERNKLNMEESWRIIGEVKAALEGHFLS